ncbi:MAG: pilus assembly protein PilP [Proteobacteria bacterium]|nr:pilus assembly protein PilP [Pseudomonadota bacterium]
MYTYLNRREKIEEKTKRGIIIKQLQKKSFLYLLCFFIFIAFSLSLYAAEPKKAKEEKQVQIGDFTYTSKDKRDPFEPTYLFKAKRGKEKQVTKGSKGEVLKSGYELEELRLVGIIMKEKNRYAMMEDMQGRGVLFKNGDLINPTIFIVDILESKVILGYSVKGELRKFEMEIQKK